MSVSERPVFYDAFGNELHEGNTVVFAKLGTRFLDKFTISDLLWAPGEHSGWVATVQSPLITKKVRLFGGSVPKEVEYRYTQIKHYKNPGYAFKNGVKFRRFMKIEC